MPTNVEMHYQRHALTTAVAVIAAIALLLVGSTLLIAAAWRLSTARASRSWRAADGVIIEARLPSNCTRCRPVINYRYVINGQSFVGDHLAAGPSDYYNPRDAQTKVGQYTMGGDVTVFYDPANPAVSCLEPGVVRWPAYIFLAMGTCCLGATFCLLWQVYRRRLIPLAQASEPAPAIERYNFGGKDPR